MFSQCAHAPLLPLELLLLDDPDDEPLLLDDVTQLGPGITSPLGPVPQYKLPLIIRQHSSVLPAQFLISVPEHVGVPPSQHTGALFSQCAHAPLLPLELDELDDELLDVVKHGGSFGDLHTLPTV